MACQPQAGNPHLPMRLCLPAQPVPTGRVWLGWLWAGHHLGHSRQEVAGRLLEGAQEGAAQGSHSGEALHVLVGQDGLPLLFALGQCHIQWLGTDDAPIHLCHGLCRLFWRGKTYKAKPLAVATLCHHLKARQDKGCWGKGRAPGAMLPPPCSGPGPGPALSRPRRNCSLVVHCHPHIY